MVDSSACCSMLGACGGGTAVALNLKSWHEMYSLFGYSIGLVKNPDAHELLK